MTSRTLRNDAHIDIEERWLYLLRIRDEAAVERRRGALTQLKRKRLARECSVCLESMKRGPPLVQTSCDHVYHRRCLSRWIAISACCPECRTPIRHPWFHNVAMRRLFRQVAAADNFYERVGVYFSYTFLLYKLLGRPMPKHQPCMKPVWRELREELRHRKLFNDAEEQRAKRRRKKLAGYKL